MTNELSFNLNDGGRSAAGFKGDAGDCVTRAIAIATGESYADVRDDLMSSTSDFRSTSRSRAAKKAKSNSVRNGTLNKVYRAYLESIDWKRVALQKFGDSKRYYMTADDLPMGIVIVEMRKHLVTVIDHVVQDSWDSRTTAKWIDGVPTDIQTPRTITAYWTMA